jgi:phosphatidylinositol kinase/protein kinase (PI-3  family)
MLLWDCWHESQRINSVQGTECGEPLAVEGQVKMLINEARDPSRLACLYFGWSSWC